MNGPGATVEVADGVYAYVQPDGSWWINNTGFVPGRRGVFAIDTCATERRTRSLLDAIGAVSDQPIRTLVNTHHHGDHTYGNALFPTATIVGHENTRAAAIAAGPAGTYGPAFEPVDWGELPLEPPFLTFRDQISVWVDDLPCEVRHIGTPAHTCDDSIVWIADRGVLFAGDLVVNGATPFVLAGSIAGAIRAAHDIKALQPDVIVPGHGPICGTEAVDAVLDYLGFVQRIAADARQAGRTPLQAARETADLDRFADWTDQERLVANLHRAYAELDGRPLGVPLDQQAIIRDMIAYNGGRPLRCHA